MSNVDLMVDLWYEKFSEILRFFSHRRKALRQFSTLGWERTISFFKETKHLAEELHNELQTCSENQSWRNSDKDDITTTKRPVQL